MKCVVFQNPDGRHLGFMHCHPDLDQPVGVCIFTGLLPESELLQTEAAELLFALREAGESQ
jgi:hypothetical protein